MALEDSEIHIVAGIGTALIAVAMALPLVLPSVFGIGGNAEAAIDPFKDMEVIDASLARRKTPKKPQQPQKQFKAPEETQKAPGVSHDENKKVDDKKPDDKKPDDKPPDLDISKYKHGNDDDPVGKPVEQFNPNDSVTLGNDEVTKGDPYFGKLKTEMENHFHVPSITNVDDVTPPLGCFQLKADGTIGQTKFKQESQGDVQIAAEAALKEFVAETNRKPEEVPAHLLQYTSRFICFKFTVK